MGVASVKLEGRMKRPEYVATVTGIYRRAIDAGRVTRGQMDRLEAIFQPPGLYRRLLSGPHRSGHVRRPAGGGETGPFWHRPGPPMNRWRIPWFLWSFT